MVLETQTALNNGVTGIEAWLMLAGTGQWRQRNGTGQPTVKVMESNTGGELTHLMKTSVRTEGRCSWGSHQQQSPAVTTEVRHLRNPALGFSFFIFDSNIGQCLGFLALLESKLGKEWPGSQVQVKGWCFISFLVMLCTRGNDSNLSCSCLVESSLSPTFYWK